MSLHTVDEPQAAAAPADRRIADALGAGYRFDGYRIEHVIAAGGFGITYLAHQLAFERRVAIKEYVPHALARRGADGVSIEPASPRDEADFAFGLERFRVEGKTLVSFEHPHIVRGYDFREANGTAYLVMQFVEGSSLLELLQRRGALPEARLRRILIPLLDGLEQVHAAGFLHRDIKPGNIIVRPDCAPVLVDFGAARCALGRRGRHLTSIVTSGFAPIEQYSDHARQGPWTDIYALGATLYYAITGRMPPDAVGRAARDDVVAAAETGAGRYSGTFLHAIDRALALQAADRPQSVAEFRVLLADPGPTPAEPLSGGGVTIALGDRAATASELPTVPPPPASLPKAVPVRFTAAGGQAASRAQATRRSSARRAWARFAAANVMGVALTGFVAWRGWTEAPIGQEARAVLPHLAAIFLFGLAASAQRLAGIARAYGRFAVSNRETPQGRISRAPAAAGLIRHTANVLAILGAVAAVPILVSAGLLAFLHTAALTAALHLWLVANGSCIAGAADRLMAERAAQGDTDAFN